MHSKAQILANLSEEEKIEYLNQFSEKELVCLLHSWEFWGRSEQQIDFNENWYTLLYLAGRGAGKTRTGSEFVIKAARDFPGCHIAIVSQTQKDVRRVNVTDGDSSILKVSPPDFIPEFHKQDGVLRWGNGSYATLYSDETRDTLRGPQHHFALCDEIAKWRYLDDTLDNLNFTMRLGKNPKVVMTTTPKNLKRIKQIMNDKTTKIVRGSTFDNAQNLPKAYLNYILETYGNSRLGKQELYAELIEDIEGAIFKRSDIDETRISFKDMPAEFEKIVIGIDVAVSTNSNSDSTGIIVVGLGLDKRLYVIADETDKYSPSDFATKVLLLNDTYQSITIKGVEIVVERNNGGSFIESTIRLTEKNLNRTTPVFIKTIWSKESKKKRAESTYLFYEIKKVSHVGYLTQLEDELCTWSENEKWSPDRMDALGFCVNYLFIHPTKSESLDNNFWNNI